MYKSLLLIAALAFSFACTKDLGSSDDDVTPGVTDTVLSSGTFVNGVHSTSGTAKLIVEAGGKKVLLLENFRTDAGPDLHLYLSASLKDNDYVELTDKVTNGNVRLEVPTSAKSSQKYVLIWCKSFSVLFGSAELK